MVHPQFSVVFQFVAGISLCWCCLFLGGCQTSRQAQAELEQENIALERQIQENYAFMQHQQRRINALEAQASNNSSMQSIETQPSTPRPTAGSSNLRQSWVNPNTRQPAQTLSPAPLDQINSDPNAVPDISVPNTPSQTVPTNLFNGTGNQGSQTSLPPALPQMSQLPQVNVSEVAEISIISDQTGPLQIDFDRQEFGLRLLLRCISKQGESVTTVGKITVVALDPTLQGELARVARWDITPEQVKRQITESPQPDGILFELAWPKDKPTGSTLDVFVRLEDETGTRLQARQTVQMDGPQYALWTPTTEQALPIVDEKDNVLTVSSDSQVPQLPQTESFVAQDSLPGEEVEHGEMAKSEVVIAEPHVEALKNRTEAPQMMASTPSPLPSVPANIATQPGQNTPPTTPAVQTASRPNWSPYR